MITPKEVAYAIFQGQRLVFWEVHSFLSNPETAGKYAVNAAFRFDRFNITAAVLENPHAGDTKTLHKAIREMLRSRGVSIFEINEKEVLDSFGVPPLKDWQELRRTTAPLFPQVQFARFMYPCLEAAALGLYFETNRLLSINTPLE